jgi:hypothetical protein
METILVIGIFESLVLALLLLLKKTNPFQTTYWQYTFAYMDLTSYPPMSK